MATEMHRSRVLLVEDEFLLCDMIAEALAEHGFEVYAVANAKDALRHLTCGSPCDILLTDINLPGSIDGAALARIARELRRTCRWFMPRAPTARSRSSTRWRARSSCPSRTIRTSCAR